MIIYADSYKNPLVPAVQDGMDVHTPYEAENMDYIFQQIQYRNRLLLEANGESVQIWRRKTEGNGLVYDNPNCAAYENSRQDPSADCPRCLGTGYIGGFTYEGETLMRIAPSGLQFTIGENGIFKASNPRSWTFPAPALVNRDILIAFDRAQITQDKMIVDERTMRQPSTSFDSLSKTGIARLLKISNSANSKADYKEKVDYELSNDGVLWKTTNKPSDYAAYFVNYQVATPHYRRFEITNVTTPYWRAVAMHQEMDIAELDVTHPAYNIAMEDPDWTRRNYPFPVSDWVNRTY